MGLRDLVKSISPPWLIGAGPPGTAGADGFGVAERLMFSIGMAADLLVEKTIQGVKARFPKVADPSCLPAIGDERQIVRGLGESDVSYATRLARFLTTWRRAGSVRGVFESTLGYLTGITPLTKSVLQGAGTTSTWDVLADGADPTTQPTRTRVTPTNWNWDGLTRPKRRWLILAPAGTTSGITWASTGPLCGAGKVCGDTTISCGFAQSVDRFRALMALVKQWKGGGTTWFGVVNFDAAKFNPAAAPGDASLPDGGWAHYTKVVGGQRVLARFTTSRYLGSVS